MIQDKGFYIVFEGGEGVGKTTQIKLLSDLLAKENIEFINVKEPGGTEFGKKYIRPLLVKNIVSKELGSDLTSHEELFLFSCDRSILMRTSVIPALNKNKIVISDRNYFTGICYQASAGTVDLDFMFEITNKSIHDCKPDLVIILDFDPKEGIKRSLAEISTQDETRFEEKELAFHNKARETWNWLYKESQNPNSKYNLPPVALIDAHDSIENIHNKILDELINRKLLKI